MRKFKDDFGLSSNRFCSYANEVWPSGDEVESFAHVNEMLNIGRRFKNGYRKRGVVDTLPCLDLYMGEARFADSCVVKSLVPIRYQDRNPNKVVTSLTYKFLMGEKINLPIFIASHMRHSMWNNKTTTHPYGMLITHIMESWYDDNLFPHGNPLIAKLGTREDRQAILKTMTRKWFREVDDLEDLVFLDDGNDDDDEDGDDDNERENGGDVLIDNDAARGMRSKIFNEHK
ncbi:hypothetical protein LIER_34122 [Lithospermum erythrorhizon]|uniref:Transposase n=1 Tax=Lithospermum erythrorhizon TaxID=34254 RepID=A0AAV3RZF9_LITER